MELVPPGINLASVKLAGNPGNHLNPSPSSPGRHRDRALPRPQQRATTPTCPRGDLKESSFLKLLFNYLPRIWTPFLAALG